MQQVLASRLVPVCCSILTAARSACPHEAPCREIRAGPTPKWGVPLFTSTRVWSRTCLLSRLHVVEYQSSDLGLTLTFDSMSAARARRSMLSTGPRLRSESTQAFVRGYNNKVVRVVIEEVVCVLPVFPIPRHLLALG